ncbi:hypothetical protein IT072_04395 [Leifsonia sp. ZF2019]|uniref:AAA family ATPase n=1 Tax=Leifsonia sp. ZF2019 TaxID=2781978 RepID=UPI001CC06199|nr:hypothetical protein [Leifsonia sp. ZF2019]UAJ80292.1 hypothetical protein IT072_04395 [Leifsonia sp. ZF2019]
MHLTVVFGRVATGKSTLTDALEKVLPGVAYRKDSIKELGFEILGVGGRPFSQALGRLSIELCIRQALSALNNGVSCLLEGNFRSETIADLIARVPQDTACVLVRCDAPDDVVLDRFSARRTTGSRHPGHGDDELAIQYQTHLPEAPDWPAGTYERLDYVAGRHSIGTVVRDVRRFAGQGPAHAGTT